MIVSEPTNLLWAWLDQRIVMPWSSDFKAIGLVNRDCLCAVVGYTAHVGRTCVAHIAIEPTARVTREFVYETLRYPFITADHLYLLSKVYASNTTSLRQQKALGFVEYDRLPGAAPDGSDLIQLKLHRDNCKVLSDVKWRKCSSRP